VYPERGLLLNPVAARIAQLCDGSHTTSEIVATLIQEYPTTPQDRIERETQTFLESLAARGLLAEAP
jgi:hypothetical protein